MITVTIKFIDGTERKFENSRRTHIPVKYEGVFASVVTQQGDTKVSFPAYRILEVIEKSD